MLRCFQGLASKCRHSPICKSRLGFSFEAKPIKGSAIEWEDVCCSLGIESIYFAEFMKNEKDLARRFDLHVRWNAPPLEFSLAKYFSERHAVLKILSILLNHEVFSKRNFSLGYLFCGEFCEIASFSTICGVTSPALRI